MLQPRLVLDECQSRIRALIVVARFPGLLFTASASTFTANDAGLMRCGVDVAAWSTICDR